MTHTFPIIVFSLATLVAGATASADPTSAAPNSASSAVGSPAKTPVTLGKLRAQVDAASKRALADPAFVAMLDRADADGAKKLLVRYGAPPSTKFAVAHLPVFVFSPGDGGLDQRLPMRCKSWETFHVPDDKGGWDYALCSGYEIVRGMYLGQE